MNAAKFWPSPTGSRMVKRTLPGGTAVSRRNSTAWSASTALARPASWARKSIDPRSGNGQRAGSVKSATASSRSWSSPGTISGICSFPTCNAPKRRAGGTAAAGGRSAQHGSSQAGNSRSLSSRTAATASANSAVAFRQASAIIPQPRP